MMPNPRQPTETREFEDDGVTWLAELFAPPETVMGGIGVPPGYDPKYKLRFTADGREEAVCTLATYELLAPMPVQRLRQLRASGMTMNRAKRKPLTVEDILTRVIPLAKRHGVSKVEVAEALGLPIEDIERMWLDAPEEPAPVVREDA